MQRSLFRLAPLSAKLREGECMCLVNPASCAFSQKEAPRFRATNQKRSKNPGRAKQCRRSFAAYAAFQGTEEGGTEEIFCHRKEVYQEKIPDTLLTSLLFLFRKKKYPASGQQTRSGANVLKEPEMQEVFCSLRHLSGNSKEVGQKKSSAEERRKLSGRSS